ncbi:MAG: 5'-nucleotidase C-terminal domain-containing protein [Saprospiraceae bacterium]|nr:5'-nucleotidase C-terminal domain-containing protein [Saprospiraceae bacterium]
MPTRFPMLIFLMILLLPLGCGDHYMVATQESRTYQIRNSKDEQVSDGVERIIAPYRSQLTEQMSEVIAEVETPLWKARPESPLGNFLADVVVSYCTRKGEQVDFATLNHGGVRISSVGKGPLTVEKVYELMPFDNTLVLMDLDGAVVLNLLDRIADDGGWPISAAVSMKIRDGKASEIEIGGSSFDREKRYRVALPNYIAEGGGDCDFLIDLPRENFQASLLRDIFIEEIREIGKTGAVSAKVETRITLNPE